MPKSSKIMLGALDRQKYGLPLDSLEPQSLSEVLRAYVVRLLNLKGGALMFCVAGELRDLVKLFEEPEEKK